MTRSVFAAMCAAGVATSASAQLQVFTDRGAWEAAVGASIVNQDFNAAPQFTFADGQIFDFGNLEVERDGSANGGDGALAISDGSQFGNIDGTQHLDGETGIDPHETVNITFDGNSVFAFGADFASPFSGDGIGLQIGNEIVLLDFITGFNTGFVGIISSGTFDTVSIVGNPATDTFQELWQADNFAYAVPTPGALAVLGLGGLAATRRRR